MQMSPEDTADPCELGFACWHTARPSLLGLYRLSQPWSEELFSQSCWRADNLCRYRARPEVTWRLFLCHSSIQKCNWGKKLKSPFS